MYLKEHLLCNLTTVALINCQLSAIYLYSINYIFTSCNQMKFYLFVDATNLIYADKNLTSLELTLNDELSKHYDWIIANK